MTTYSQPMPNPSFSRNFLHTAAVLSAAFLSIGFAAPVLADAGGARSPAVVSSAALSEHTLLAQAPSENTMARCQQLFGLWSRHNTDGYAKPLDARMGLEECQKGNVAGGVATLKSALERAQISIPPAASGLAESPAAPLRPRGEKRHQTP